ARDERNLDKRIEEIISLCTVIDAHPVLISEKMKVSNKHLSCICMDELSTLPTPEDLFATD
ncbi:MAG: hypothetical protein NWE84_04945, partial [Candidatus Bathyarchaeota archaeon]|nr:hypothetical protein [Candidatus Bathyarchaeota archaeon]